MELPEFKRLKQLEQENARLKKLLAERGAPKTLRSDNGREFVSLAVLGWLNRSGVKSAFIAPGKPWQNGTN